MKYIHTNTKVVGVQFDAIERNIHTHDYIMSAVLFSITVQQLETSPGFKIATVKNLTGVNKKYIKGIVVIPFISIHQSLKYI